MQVEDSWLMSVCSVVSTCQLKYYSLYPKCKTKSMCKICVWMCVFLFVCLCVCVCFCACLWMCVVIVIVLALNGQCSLDGGMSKIFKNKDSSDSKVSVLCFEELTPL